MSIKIIWKLSHDHRVIELETQEDASEFAQSVLGVTRWERQQETFKGSTPSGMAVTVEPEEREEE